MSNAVNTVTELTATLDKLAREISDLADELRIAEDDTNEAEENRIWPILKAANKRYDELDDLRKEMKAQQIARLDELKEIIGNRARAIVEAYMGRDEDFPNGISAEQVVSQVAKFNAFPNGMIGVHGKVITEDMCRAKLTGRIINRLSRELHWMKEDIRDVIGKAFSFIE